MAHYPECRQTPSSWEEYKTHLLVSKTFPKYDGVCQQSVYCALFTLMVGNKTEGMSKQFLFSTKQRVLQHFTSQPTAFIITCFSLDQSFKLASRSITEVKTDMSYQHHMGTIISVSTSCRHTSRLSYGLRRDWRKEPIRVSFTSCHAVKQTYAGNVSAKKCVIVASRERRDRLATQTLRKMGHVSFHQVPLSWRDLWSTWKWLVNPQNL